jgi:hypothetical protein
MTTLAENSAHNSAQDNQNDLPASITAYFDTVILPLWLDIDPKTIGIDKITAYLPCMAFFAGDRIEIRSKLQAWAYQLAPTFPTYYFDELIKDCKFDLSKVAGPYASTDPLKPITLNSNRILEDLEDFLISLDCKLSPSEARKALEHIVDFCKDEVEFTSVADGKMRSLIYGFNDGEWKNAIADFKRRINDRRYERIKQEKNQVIQNTKNQVERAKNEIKAWLLEDDLVAKALTRSSICRVYGLDKKTFDVIADSLDENSSKPKTKQIKLNEFMVLPTGGNPLLAPGVASMGVTIFAGNPGAGKTTLAYDLAGAVLMGDEFLGEVPSRQGSVLFVNCDESYQWGQDKFINRGIAGHVSDDKVTILLDWDVSQWSDLETTVEDMRPTLLIVDSFNAIHNDPNFDENSAQASQTVKKLERLSAKYCVPIVLIHHLGKSKENKGVNKLRGSTAIAASVSSVLILEGEGTQKRLYQPKIRGSEPLDLTVEMDCENGRFRVTGGNVTDDATKSLTAKLIDLFAANPDVLFENIELRDHFPGIERKTLTNALNKILGTVIGNGKIIKRPSKVNQKFKVYGLECTNAEGLSPYTPLSPSSPSVNSGDYEAETITTQSLEVVTALSPDCHLDCHLIEDDKTVMITESLTQPDCHLVTTKSESRGESVSPIVDDNDGVLTFETFGTPLIIEVEKPNNLESENVDEPQQKSEPTKTAASFRFQVGDRGRIGQRIKDKTTGEIHTITSIENDRYGYDSHDSSWASIPFVDALTDLDPDEF